MATVSRRGASGCGTSEGDIELQFGGLARAHDGVMPFGDEVTDAHKLFFSES